MAADGILSSLEQQCRPFGITSYAYLYAPDKLSNYSWQSHANHTAADRSHRGEWEEKRKAKI